MKELEGYKETIAFQTAYINYRDVVDPADVPWLETFKAGWEARGRYEANMMDLAIMKAKRRAKKKTHATKKRSIGARKKTAARKPHHMKGKHLSEEHRRKISEGRRKLFRAPEGVPGFVESVAEQPVSQEA